MQLWSHGARKCGRIMALGKMVVFNFAQSLNLWVLETSQPVTSNLGACVPAKSSIHQGHSGAQADVTVTLSHLASCPP